MNVCDKDAGASVKFSTPHPLVGDLRYVTCWKKTQRVLQQAWRITHWNNMNHQAASNSQSLKEQLRRGRLQSDSPQEAIVHESGFAGSP